MFPKIRELRKSNNLTQKDMASKLEVTQQTYQMFESSTKIIPLKHLIKLCTYYKVSLNYISGLTNTNSQTNLHINLDQIEIGKRIKLIRLKCNLLQIDLARLLNTSQSQISSYEHGTRLISTAFAYQICKTYNISLDWLINGTGKVFLNDN